MPTSTSYTMPSVYGLAPAGRGTSVGASHQPQSGRDATRQAKASRIPRISSFCGYAEHEYDQWPASVPSMIHDEKGARDRAWCELQRAKTAGNSTRVRLSTTSCPSGMRKHKKTSVQHVRDDSAPLPPTTARKHAESSRHPNTNVVTPSIPKGKQPFKAPRTDITSHYRQYGKALDAASAKTKKIEQTDGPEQPSHAQKEALAKFRARCLTLAASSERSPARSQRRRPELLPSPTTFGPNSNKNIIMSMTFVGMPRRAAHHKRFIAEDIACSHMTV
jgi:hypothetical protein